MKPIEFEGHNIVYAKDQPEYLSLPGKKIEGPQGELITCWELSDEEIAILVKTKKLWLSIWTFGQPLQPIRPYVENNGPDSDTINIQFFHWKGWVELDHKEREEAYNRIKEALKSENKEYILETTASLIKEEGAAKIWPRFKFETSLPNHVSDLHLAFEWMQYLTKWEEKTNFTEDMGQVY